MSSATLSKKQELITILYYNGAVVTECKLPRLFCCRNPRPPHGGRPQKGFLDSSGVSISIHVPRAGDDLDVHIEQSYLCVFQSTSPVRGTTISDMSLSQAISLFQSTSPVRGTTRGYVSRKSDGIIFQSTSPVRGTTQSNSISKGDNGISIHVPRAGDDQLCSNMVLVNTDFNPRPPCGGRPLHLRRNMVLQRFQSTSPVRGTTAKPYNFSGHCNTFCITFY